ncbi:hypothetical protein F1559_001491 [Cyanidiococcus yangmingshanensis]|uniref:Uncharacterized protein n=1 Tax=Cyanidiococcus yangmingshanensis TaxID=2690220 RepID=A0A7J7IDT1_9RHOD|nr:hypothetical protein F1559_001491 [Cyanidiococcus yangmingshanensis]
MRILFYTCSHPEDECKNSTKQGSNGKFSSAGHASACGRDATLAEHELASRLLRKRSVFEIPFIGNAVLMADLRAYDAYRGQPWFRGRKADTDPNPESWTWPRICRFWNLTDPAQHFGRAGMGVMDLVGDDTAPLAVNVLQSESSELRPET